MKIMPPLKKTTFDSDLESRNQGVVYFKKQLY